MVSEAGTILNITPNKLIFSKVISALGGRVPPAIVGLCEVESDKALSDLAERRCEPNIRRPLDCAAFDALAHRRVARGAGPPLSRVDPSGATMRALYDVAAPAKLNLHNAWSARRWLPPAAVGLHADRLVRHTAF